jgi:hypothetical protein
VEEHIGLLPDVLWDDEASVSLLQWALALLILALVIVMWVMIFVLAAPVCYTR